MLAIGLNLLRDVLLVGGTLGALVLVLAALRRGNVLLFWCVLGAVSLHLGMAGFLWAAGRFNGSAAEIAPAPVTIVSGKCPATVATLVIKTGRKRNSEASRMATILFLPAR